jgi:hypothetical protein
LTGISGEVKAAVANERKTMIEVPVQRWNILVLMFQNNNRSGTDSFRADFVPTPVRSMKDGDKLPFHPIRFGQQKSDDEVQRFSWFLFIGLYICSFIQTETNDGLESSS